MIREREHHAQGILHENEILKKKINLFESILNSEKDTAGISKRAMEELEELDKVDQSRKMLKTQEGLCN